MTTRKQRINLQLIPQAL